MELNPDQAQAWINMGGVQHIRVEEIIHFHVDWGFPLCFLFLYFFCLKWLKTYILWGAGVAQSVKRPTSAQVMTSRSASLSPVSGFVLTAQSLEPASDSVSFSLPLPHSPSVSIKNKY